MTTNEILVACTQYELEELAKRGHSAAECELVARAAAATMRGIDWRGCGEAMLQRLAQHGRSEQVRSRAAAELATRKEGK